MISKKSVVLPAVLAFLVAGCAPEQADTDAEDAVQAPPDSTPTIILETTMGQIVMEVDMRAAPRTVSNFLAHVNAGFYNGLQFHRVMPNFMIQTGRLTADYSPRAMQVPFLENEDTGLHNVRGAVAMARGSDAHSAKSEFFINVKDNPQLDHEQDKWGWAVFGRVVEGMDVVDRIKDVPTRDRGTRTDVPVEPVVIERAYVDNDWQPTEPEGEGGV